MGLREVPFVSSAHTKGGYTQPPVAPREQYYPHLSLLCGLEMLRPRLTGRRKERQK